MLEADLQVRLNLKFLTKTFLYINQIKIDRYMYINLNLRQEKITICTYLYIVR